MIRVGGGDQQIQLDVTLLPLRAGCGVRCCCSGWATPAPAALLIEASGGRDADRSQHVLDHL
jgi:hypothetical protein